MLGTKCDLENSAPIGYVSIRTYIMQYTVGHEWYKTGQYVENNKKKYI